MFFIFFLIFRLQAFIASQVPPTVMKEAFRAFDLLKEMTEKGNPNSVTDALVGVLATRACIRGAFLNVQINVKGLKDSVFANSLLVQGMEMEANAAQAEEELVKML